MAFSVRRITFICWEMFWIALLNSILTSEDTTKLVLFRWTFEQKLAFLKPKISKTKRFSKKVVGAKLSYIFDKINKASLRTVNFQLISTYSVCFSLNLGTSGSLGQGSGELKSSVTVLNEWLTNNYSCRNLYCSITQLKLNFQAANYPSRLLSYSAEYPLRIRCFGIIFWQNVDNMKFLFFLKTWLPRVTTVFWARVLCSLAAEDACFRMRITLGVVLIRSLVFHVCVPECSRNGSGMRLYLLVREKFV